MVNRPENEMVVQKRAGNAAAMGLGMQLLLALLALLLLVMVNRQPIWGIFVFALAGIIPWLAILITAALRRGKTVEDFELDAALRSGESERTIFASEADARPARRRLFRFTRWGLPIFSALLGLTLLGFGISYFRFIASGVGSTELVQPTILAGLSASFAFLGFVLGRYLLGMASTTAVPNWGILRGGSTYLIGTVYLLGLLAVAAAARVLGTDAVNAVFAWVVPVVCMVVGAEVLLNIVLDFYRPKTADQQVTPAFDSRLLNLLASPGGVVQSLNDAINYQFGFEITRSWFWRLLSRSFASLVLFGIGALVVLSTVVVIEPHQRGLRTTFGRLDADLKPLDPGLHFKAPWPVGRVERFDVGRVQQITVGSHERLLEPTADGRLPAVLWTNQHAPEERLLLVAPAPDDDAREAAARAAETPGAMMPRGPGAAMRADVMARPDLPTGPAPAIALAAAEVFVQWRIDPSDEGVFRFATHTADPSYRLRQIAETALARQMLRHDIDSAIGVSREQIARDVEADILTAIERENLGIQILWVGLAGVHPAQQVAEEFNLTVASEQRRQEAIQLGLQEVTRILTRSAGTVELAERIEEQIQRLNDLSEAARRGEASEEEVEQQRLEVERLVQAAGGEAARKLLEARRDRWQLENRERVRAATFSAEAAAHANAPQYYRLRRYLEVLEQHLPDREKLVILADIELPPVIRFDMRRTLDLLGDIGLGRRGPDEPLDE